MGLPDDGTNLERRALALNVAGEQGKRSVNLRADTGVENAGGKDSSSLDRGEKKVSRPLRKESDVDF